MRAGKLDRRVTILKREQVGTTDLNQPIFDWLPLRTVWAQKIHRREDEEFAAAQRYAVRVVTFRMRWIDDEISEVDRLACDGVTYSITGIRELGRRIGLEIAAEWQE